MPMMVMVVQRRGQTPLTEPGVMPHAQSSSRFGNTVDVVGDRSRGHRRTPPPANGAADKLLRAPIRSYARPVLSSRLSQWVL
jgi:hypothetical protein